MKEKTEVYEVSYTSVLGTRKQQDAPELIRKEEERPLKNANAGFVWAGVGAIAAGVILSLAAFLPSQTFWGVSMPGAIAVTGAAAVGLGLLGLYKYVFLQKPLNLPSLKIIRKTEEDRKQKPARQVDNTSLNRVFFGVAGGIANITGLPATLIRFLFVGGFFVTVGLMMFFYLFLALVMPPEKRGERLLEAPQQNPGPR